MSGGVTDLIGLVGLGPVRGVAILDGIDSHRADAQFVGGAESPDRDLAPVRDQNFGNHWPGRDQWVVLSARCGGPTYSLSGRISAFDAVCSIMWAVHPVIRLITKIGVKAPMSKPIRW